MTVSGQFSFPSRFNGSTAHVIEGQMSTCQDLLTDPNLPISQSQSPVEDDFSRDRAKRSRLLDIFR
jgi:hypothetical protein